MSIDSFHFIQEIHHINTKDSCACSFDSLSNSQWYNFYHDAYANLISSHSALFGTLIAVMVGLFAFKYYFDNIKIKKLEKSFEKKVDRKYESITQEVQKITETDWDVMMIEHITQVLKISLPLMTESCLDSVDNALKLFLSFLQNHKASFFIAGTINEFLKQIENFSTDSLKKLNYLEKFITEINQKISNSGDWALYIEKNSIEKINQKRHST